MDFVRDQQQTQTLYNISHFLNKLNFSQVAQWSPECETQPLSPFEAITRDYAATTNTRRCTEMFRIHMIKGQGSLRDAINLL